MYVYEIELEFRSVGFMVLGRKTGEPGERQTTKSRKQLLEAIHGTAIGAKLVAVAFANIFMAVIETKMISQSKKEPKRMETFLTVGQ